MTVNPMDLYIQNNISAAVVRNYGPGNYCLVTNEKSNMPARVNTFTALADIEKAFGTNTKTYLIAEAMFAPSASFRSTQGQLTIVELIDFVDATRGKYIVPNIHFSDFEYITNGSYAARHRYVDSTKGINAASLLRSTSWLYSLDFSTCKRTNENNELDEEASLRAVAEVLNTGNLNIYFEIEKKVVINGENESAEYNLIAETVGFGPYHSFTIDTYGAAADDVGILIGNKRYANVISGDIVLANFNSEEIQGKTCHLNLEIDGEPFVVSFEMTQTFDRIEDLSVFLQDKMDLDTHIKGTVRVMAWGGKIMFYLKREKFGDNETIDIVADESGLEDVVDLAASDYLNADVSVAKPSSSSNFINGSNAVSGARTISDALIEVNDYDKRTFAGVFLTSFDLSCSDVADIVSQTKTKIYPTFPSCFAYTHPDPFECKFWQDYIDLDSRPYFAQSCGRFGLGKAVTQQCTAFLMSVLASKDYAKKDNRVPNIDLMTVEMNGFNSSVSITTDEARELADAGVPCVAYIKTIGWAYSTHNDINSFGFKNAIIGAYVVQKINSLQIDLKRNGEADLSVKSRDTLVGELMNLGCIMLRNGALSAEISEQSASSARNLLGLTETTEEIVKGIKDLGLGIFDVKVDGMKYLLSIIINLNKSAFGFINNICFTVN